MMHKKLKLIALDRDVHGTYMWDLFQTEKSYIGLVNK